jgi:hypothetical protein
MRILKHLVVYRFSKFFIRWKAGIAKWFRCKAIEASIDRRFVIDVVEADEASRVGSWTAFETYYKVDFVYRVWPIGVLFTR